LVAGNNTSKAATWFDVKFLTNMVSYAPLDTDETGAAGGAMPIFFMRSTSSRLVVGMCANGWAAIRLLLIGRGRFVVAFVCLGGLAINGDFCLCCTSSVNRARH
jgi:hypothetical protein